MQCINLDKKNNKAYVPIKSKRGPGYNLVDSESTEGKEWIAGNIGRMVQIQYLGSDQTLFHLTINGPFTYDSLFRMKP